MTLAKELTNRTLNAINANQGQTMTNDTYLSDKSLAKRYDVTRSTVWRWAQAGRLPSPVKLSPGCSRWRASDIADWEAKRVGEVAK
jgi:prophage regulatory protein